MNNGFKQLSWIKDAIEKFHFQYFDEKINFPVFKLSISFSENDFDYYVRKVQEFRKYYWEITKCTMRGEPLSVYFIYEENNRLICNCKAGSRHFECKHKFMIKVVQKANF